MEMGGFCSRRFQQRRQNTISCGRSSSVPTTATSQARQGRARLSALDVFPGWGRVAASVRFLWFLLSPALGDGWGRVVWLTEGGRNMNSALTVTLQEREFDGAGLAGRHVGRLGSLGNRAGRTELEFSHRPHSSLRPECF